MTKIDTAAQAAAVAADVAAAHALARKAKALKIGISAGKAVALIGVGVVGTIGVQKFQARNAQQQQQAQ